MNLRISSCYSLVVHLGLMGSALWLASCDKHAESSGPPSAKEPRGINRHTKLRAERIEGYRAAQRKLSSSKNSLEGIAYLDAQMMEQLKKQSPEDLVDLLESLDPKNNEADRGLVFKIIHALAELDPARALDVAERLSSVSSAVASSFLYEELIKADPSAVAQWISKNGVKSASGYNLAMNCAWKLASNAPDDAINMILTCDEKTRRKFGGAMLRVIAKTDPERALQIAEKFSPEGRAEAYIAAIGGISQNDGGLAFQALAKMRDPAVGPGVYPTLFSAWIKQDPKTAGEALSTIPAASIQSVLENATTLTNLISRDPNLVTNALDQMVFTEANARIFEQATRELAAKDPDKAVAWLKGFPESVKKAGLMREVATSWAAKNPEVNIPTILNQQWPYRNDIVEGVGTAWGRADTGRALEYVTSLPGAEQRLYAMAVLTASSKRSPDATVKCISDNSLPATVRDSNEYRGMVRSTASNFAARDLQTAVTWVTSLPAEVSAAAVSGVASQWARKDPAATGKWILQLPSGPVKNAAIQALVGQIERTDPDAARQWQASITK